MYSKTGAKLHFSVQHSGKFYVLHKDSGQTNTVFGQFDVENAWKAEQMFKVWNDVEKSVESRKVSTKF